MSLVQVKVVRGAYTAQAKAVLIERLTQTMVELEGAALRSTIWVTVEEVDPAHWAIGGRPVTAQDLRDLGSRSP